MRGNRYGWEEAAVDVGAAAVEAATAGAAGALSKGAKLGAAARAASLADDAAKAASTAEKIGKLGRVARAGAGLGQRMGGTAAGVATEVGTSVASGTANAAMRDELWSDGLGTGLLRLAGHGAQSGIAAAVTAGLSGGVQGRLDKRLAPLIGDPDTVSRLTKMGRGLSPNAREILTETVAGLAGSLGGEGINILADFLRHPDKMKQSEIIERLGKAGLQELFSTAGKTAIKQKHRARYETMHNDLVKSGRTPTSAELDLMNKLAVSADLQEPGAGPEDIGVGIARAQEQVRAEHDAAIASMPTDLQPFLRQMPRDTASEVMNKVRGGDLGSDADRATFAKGLASDIEGFDPDAFDSVLGKARDEHAAAQKAHRDKIEAARAEVFGTLPPRAQETLKALPLEGLAELSPEDRATIARRLADGEPPGDVLNTALKEQPELRERLEAELDAAAQVVADANAEDSRAKARIQDDLAAAVPKDLAPHLENLGDSEKADLHAALASGDTKTASALLQKSGLDEGAAARVASGMERRIEAQQVRREYMDNVPEEHREAMSQLTPDMLMEIRVAQFTKKPLSVDRVGEILAEVKARRPNANTDALRAAMTATMATAHGRPGFRTALAQKRALLDLVPLGMKRKVLRTPVITMDDAAFFAFVKGSGSEHAVTLIVNGEAVVLMRASAEPSKLAEEGLHVLQYNDPEYRTRIAGLEERRIARWDEMDFDGRMNAYETKIDVEIDAQRRTIARLERRLQYALLGSTKTQALRQLEMAHASLDALMERKGALSDISPEMREEMRLGLRPEPDWLEQPARMFNKGDDPEFDDILRTDLPAGRMPVVERLYKAMKRQPELSREDQRRLVGLLRVMKGAVDIEHMKAALDAFHRDPPPAGFEDLAPREGEDTIDALQRHLFDTGHATGKTTNLAKRRHAMQRILRDKKIGDSRVISEARARRLLTALADTSDTRSGLSMAKRAMFLSLEIELQNPRGRSHEQLRARLEMAEAILNIGPQKGRLTGLAGHPRLQAFALEALATTKTLMLPEYRPKASLDGLIAAINNLTDFGIEHFSETHQKALFQTLARAFYSRNDDAALMAIGSLPELIIQKVGPANRPVAGEMMTEILDLLSHHSIGHTETVLGKLRPLIALAVDYSGTGAKDRVTIAQLHDYVAKAVGDLQFAKSLIRIAGRMEVPSVGKDPALLSADIAAIESGRQVAGQAEFLDRHSKPLDSDHGRGVDLEQDREQVAADIQLAAGLGGVHITREEARAIAKRVEVLDQSALFSSLTQDPKARHLLTIEFIKKLDAAGGFNSLPAEADRNKRGEKIEKMFREFVRDAAAGTENTGILVDILKGGSLPGQSEPLPAIVRTELILALVRGAPSSELSHLDDEIQLAVDNALKEMIADYLLRSEGSFAPQMKGKIESDLEQMLLEGIIHTETAAKGSMLESMFEGLLRLQSSADGDPTLFDDISSLTDLPRPGEGKPKRTEFAGFDAKDGSKLRSADHVIQIAEDAADLPAGLEAGDAVAVDSKNGPGAFQEDQFKRYLVDMIKAHRTGDGGLFAARGTADQEAGTGLTALIYLSDSAKNAESTRAKAAEVLRKILQTAAADGADVSITIGDATYAIPLAEFQRIAEGLTIHFGRLSSAGADQAGNRQLGPITMEDDGDMIDQVVQEFVKKKNRNSNDT